MNHRRKCLPIVLTVSLLILAQVWTPSTRGQGPSVVRKSSSSLLSLWARQDANRTPPPELLAELPHTGWVSDVSLSPDGRYLATCSFIDQTIQVWDVEKATEVRRRTGSPFWAVSFSPDGKLLAASVQGAETILIDFSTWTVVKRLGGGEPQFLCCRGSVAFSPDGKTLLAGGRGQARLWEVGSGREEKSFPVDGKVSSVAFSPDGRLIALACESVDVALVIERASGKEVLRINKGVFFPTSVVFSPDGKTLLVGSHAGAHTWDVATGERMQRFGAAFVQAATFAAGGKRVLLAGKDSTKGSVSLWDTATGDLLTKFGDALQKYGVAISRDGCLVAAGGEGDSKRGPKAYRNVASVWNLCERLAAREEPEFPPRPRPQQGQPVMSVQLGNVGHVGVMAFSPVGTLIATTGGGVVALWQAATGREIRRLSTRGDEVLGLYFSDDERKLLTVSQARVDNAERYTLQLWDTTTGEELKSFQDLAEQPKQIAISSDGKLVMAEEKDGRVRLMEVMSGKEVKSFEGGRPEAARAIAGWRLTGRLAAGEREAVSPDGRLKAEVMLTEQTRVLLEEAATGKSRYLDHHETHVHSVLFSPDGKYLLGDGEGAVLWDVETGKQTHRFEGLAGPVYSASFSKDGRTILTTSLLGENYTATAWDTASGAERRRVKHPADGFWLNLMRYSAAISPDEKSVLTGSASGDVRMWNMDTGRETNRLSRPLGKLFQLTSLGFSPDGKQFLIGQIGGASLWRVDGATPAKKLKGLVYVNKATFSPDGRFVAATSNDKKTVVWEAQSGQPLRLYDEHNTWVVDVAFSPDCRYLVTAEVDGAVRLWDNASGELVRLFQESAAAATSVRFSLDGNYILSGGGDGVARLWDRRTGALVQRYEGRSWVNTVDFSPKGDFVLTAGNDGVARLWRTSTAEELCRLISFRDGTWAVIAPDGRFDTNNLERPDGIYWLMPDDPWRALPLEIFMRDYYEPRLLPRILDEIPDAEQFKPVPPLARLNRAQPAIDEIKVSRTGVDTVAVRVTAKRTTSSIQKGPDGKPLESGLYDLRLFRDGQLVGYTTPAEADATAGQVEGTDEELPRWREANRVTPGVGKADAGACSQAADGGIVCAFQVRLPRRADLKRIEFSAYAFNADRVKSETARSFYEVENPPPAVKPRAYVISVGVNVYDNPAFKNLSYAVNDALAVRNIVGGSIERAGSYEVVPVTLLSEKGKGGADGATKANIKAVLDVLAGRLEARDLTRLPGVRGLRRAAPEDLALITFSGHGYADRRGRFYLVPHDTSSGMRVWPAQAAPQMVSTEELSRWLRGVDAGEMALVIDACHSAAAAGAEFRPGPMGDRGLGQLSYDKGMRILAATRAEGEAREAAALANGRRAEHGLLTYALVREGLAMGLADQGPRKDGFVTLGEWLRYGEVRVPMLRPGAGRGRTAGPKGNVIDAGKDDGQRPVLFDFSRRHAEVLLARPNAGTRRRR